MTPEQIEKWGTQADDHAHSYRAENFSDATPWCVLRDTEFARLARADLVTPLDEVLSAVQDVLEAAYHRCYPTCCGRAGMECCGSPLQTWSPDDEHIMKTLGPIERTLRESIRAEAAKETK
jgi:hypothetical protein